MIEYRKGDIFESGCEALTNPVNCVGVMGKGLASQFKKRYPAMFKEYREMCDAGLLRPGILHVWTNPEGGWVINFPTKDHYRKASQKGYINTGLAALTKVLKGGTIKSVAIPALGCGLGGLSWGAVKQMIETFHNQLPPEIKVVVYEP